jgi:hypothetical protein
MGQERTEMTATVQDLDTMDGAEQGEMLPERTIRELTRYDSNGNPFLTVRHYYPERPRDSYYGHSDRYQIIAADGSRLDFYAATARMILEDLRHLFPEDKTVYAVTA